MSYFSFTLSHNLIVFFSISSDCTSWSSHLCFSHNGWMALFASALHSSVFLTQSHLSPNGLSFLFLLFSLVCLTHLLNFALNQKLTLEAWGSKLINWPLTNVTSKWARPFRCHAPNMILILSNQIERLNS